MPAEYDAGIAIVQECSWIDTDGRTATGGKADEVVVERDDLGESRPRTSGHVARIDGWRSRHPHSEDLRKECRRPPIRPCSTSTTCSLA